MDIIIRHATTLDAPLIVLEEKKIAETPGLFCSKPSELIEQNVLDTILLFNESGHGVYLVAEFEGKLVGHAFLKKLSLSSLRHVAQLNIAVHSGWQNQGIGSKLLKSLIEWAKNESTIEKIQLNVRSSNHSAIFLYKKMGFKEEGRLINQLKIGNTYIDDLVMGLFLNPSHSDRF